jgi:hypothetical protein
VPQRTRDRAHMLWLNHDGWNVLQYHNFGFMATFGEDFEQRIESYE